MPNDQIEVNPNYIEELIAKAKGSDKVACLEAIRKLGEIGSARAMPILLELLKGPNLGLRYDASLALAKIGGPSIEQLIMLLSLRDKDLLRPVVEGLGEAKDSRAVAPLIALIKDEQSPIRGGAAKALAKIGGPSVPALTQLLDSTDNYVIELALAALLVIADEHSAKPALHLLRHPESKIRKLAAELLGKVQAIDAVDALIQLLDDPEVVVRRQGAIALGEIGDEKAIIPLITAIQDYSASNIYYHAADALGKIGAAAVPYVTDLYNNSDSAIRYAAVRALTVGNDDAFAVHIAATRDPESAIRLLAVAKLLDYDEPQSVEAIATLLTEDTKLVQGKIIEMLAERPIREQRIINLLFTAQYNQNAIVRENATLALGKLGGDIAIKALSRALHDENSDVKMTALSLLTSINDTQAVELMISKLNDRDAQVRIAAISALGQSHSAAALPILVQLLDNNDKQTVATAISALGELGDKRAILPLIGELQNDYVYARYYAAEALGRIGDEQAIPALSHTAQFDEGQVANISTVKSAAEQAIKLIKEKTYKQETAADLRLAVPQTK